MSDEHEIDDDLAALDPSDPASGPRAKGSGARSVELFYGELVRRSKGKTGAELEAEIERFKERLIERNLEAAPPALRAKLRRRLHGLLANDPGLREVVGRIRQAAVAER